MRGDLMATRPTDEFQAMIRLIQTLKRRKSALSLLAWSLHVGLLANTYDGDAASAYSMKQLLTLEGFVEARRVKISDKSGRIHGFKEHVGRTVLVVVLEDDAKRSAK